MKSKVAGIAFLAGSLYYIIAEAVSATFFNDTLFNTYVFHTISELGVPNANSPLFWLMNSAFFLIGLILIFSNFYKLRDLIVKNRMIFYVLTLITGIGVIIVALIHGGNPINFTYHASGAIMAMLGGNVMLIAISRSMNDFGGYQKASLALGCVGLAAFWIMFFDMQGIFMPVFERLAVYALIIWCFMTGLFLAKS